jgi:hypothetical protein
VIKIFIKQTQDYSKPLEYILSIFSKNKSIPIAFVNSDIEAHLIFDHNNPSSVPINISFYDSLINHKIYNHESYFRNEPYIHYLNSDKRDYLASAFYLINAFQEYHADESPESMDKYGRFSYAASYQKKFDCIENNIVQYCFDQFAQSHEVFHHYASATKPKTKVFISHDIDTIYGSFTQDGMWALRRGRFDIILKLVMNEFLAQPHWKNIDQIVKLHTEHDLKSTFFWIATNKVADNGIKNADYNIRAITDQTRIPESNGLHKSCYPFSIDDELDMLPFQTELNRYHFLKFKLPDAWKEINDSRLRYDASLGFAEHFGFRNSYGLPFSPYNLDDQSAYRFVEVPLHIMDRTLQGYMNVPVNQTAEMIIDFIEQHKTQCILSILWHNTFYSEYKYSGYLKEYKKILIYLHEAGIESITPSEIINEYTHGK